MSVTTEDTATTPTNQEDTDTTSTPTTKKSKVEMPALPDAIRNPAPTQPKTIAMGSIFLAKYDEANDVLEEFAKIRRAKDESKKVLETSSHPKAVEYRSIKAETDSTVKHIEEESDEAKEIKRLKQIIADKVKSAREAQEKVRIEAQQEVTGEIVSEFDPTTLAQKLGDINSVLNSLKGVLKDEVPELAKWNTVNTNAALGEKGSSGKRGSTDVKRPRLRYAFVDNVPVEPAPGKDYPTATQVSKVLGIKEVGHFNSLMFQACGNPEQLPYEEFHFQLEVNGQPHTVRIAGRTGSDEELAA